MPKEDIKRVITDICDNRLKALGEYEFFKDASLEIKFWRVTGLVNNDIEGIIDRCEESKLDTLISEFTYYIPSGSAFESSDDPGPGPNPYASKYFTIVALENTTISINIPNGGLSYSLNSGNTWSTKSGSFTVNVQSGGKLLLKGDVVFNGTPPSTAFIQSTGNYSVEGNIMSLSHEDDFVDKKTIQVDREYIYLFAYDTKLISAENLVLPATSLAKSCYSNMFKQCSSLTTAPKILPATALAQNCYQYMFEGCTSLTTAPELPTTTLAEHCYDGMFVDCTSLTTAPELPATALADYCYVSMFAGCTTLTTAPELPVTTLADYCCASMFADCTSLTTVPELPATTLAQSCYENMFMNCTSLTTAPELSATTLAKYCYRNMFKNCTNLNYIKALFLTTPGSDYTANWVSNVSATGIFIRNENATWQVRGYNGIPNGWDVEPPFPPVQ